VIKLNAVFSTPVGCDLALRRLIPIFMSFVNSGKGPAKEITEKSLIFWRVGGFIDHDPAESSA
jgi:hypothetical protein